MGRALVHAEIFLQDFNTVEKFGYNRSTWPPKIRFRIKYSIFCIPPDFIVGFLKDLTAGGYKEGWAGYKCSLMYAF